VPTRKSEIRNPKSEIRFFLPRPTVRHTLNWSVNLFLGDGKNYSPDFGLPGTFYEHKSPDGEKRYKYLDLGENPPQGAIIYYHLESEPEQPIEITVLDANGEEIETFSSKKADDATADQAKDAPEDEDDKKTVVPAKPGLNRFVWNLRYPGPKEKIDKSLEEPGYKPLGHGEWNASSWPLATPGTYQDRLKSGGVETTHAFEILKDPRLDTTPDDFAAQFELWMQIRDKVSEANGALNRIRRIKRQLKELSGRDRLKDSESEVQQAATALRERLDAVENALVQTQYETPSDRLRHPAMLKERLEGLVGAVAVADARPPEQVQAVFHHLCGQIDEQLALVKTLEEQEVAALNALIQEMGIPALEG